jgi:hypothetical protein
MKKIGTILLTLMFMSTSVAAHYIGEQYKGGVIFWVDEVSEHGLIAATEDLSIDITWFNGNYTASHAIRDGIFSGKDNTHRIVEVQGVKTSYAAREAINYKGNGYDDWYLPSRHELNLMYMQKNMIGGFANHIYWSSTELSANPLLGVCIQDFSTGDQFVSLKEYKGNVRVIRSF